MKTKILFLCTGNSCRSQMAEAWCNAVRNADLEAYSAGIEKHGLNPYAVEVMREAGIDLSRHYSKHPDELSGIRFDYVITVCGHAHEHCPIFPAGCRMLHLPFEDPPKLAAQCGNLEARLNCYRTVRDAIRKALETLELP